MHFKLVMNTKSKLVASLPTRQTAIGGHPKVASYDKLGEQFHYCNPVKRDHSIYCRQHGRVAWMTVYSEKDRKFKPHHSHLAVSLGKALYGNFSSLLGGL